MAKEGPDGPANPPRHGQIYETWRYHLKLREPGCQQIRNVLQFIDQMRGKAVHPGAEFQDPVYRPDINRAVDWHYATFRAEHAVKAVVGGMQILDILLGCMSRGNDALKEWEPHASKRFETLMDIYDDTDLPPVPRAVRAKPDNGSETPTGERI